MISMFEKKLCLSKTKIDSWKTLSIDTILSIGLVSGENKKKYLILGKIYISPN